MTDKNFMKNIAIIGASGGIGSTLVKLLSTDPTNTIYAFSRSGNHEAISTNIHLGRIDFNNESTIEKAAELTQTTGHLDLVIVASGMLHQGNMMPEKSLKELNTDNLLENFLVNSIGPALVAKYFLPLLNKKKRSVFSALSARVGSISDNKLGGWYAYRASKAALNMLLKTASVELARKNKNAIVVGIHPGTVDTALSKPFQKRIPEHQLFNKVQSANHILQVIDQLTVKDSGKCFAWDGQEISS